MSRSGYSDCLDSGELNLWRGAVDRAIKGRRGQAFLREMLAALDAMPTKRLIENDLVRFDGEVCAMGAVAKARGCDLSNVVDDDPESVARAFGIARALAAEIAFENDDDFSYTAETPEARWSRMRAWAVSQIKEPDRE